MAYKRKRKKRKNAKKPIKKILKQPKVLKTVNVTEDLHNKIKMYCSYSNLKMNEWIANTLKKRLSFEVNKLKKDGIDVYSQEFNDIDEFTFENNIENDINQPS